MNSIKTKCKFSVQQRKPRDDRAEMFIVSKTREIRISDVQSPCKAVLRRRQSPIGDLALGEATAGAVGAAVCRPEAAEPC